MTTRNELSIRVKESHEPRTTWADLERGLAATLPALGQAHLVISTEVGNHYVQFAADPEDGLRAEVVSNAFLEPDLRHTSSQMAALLELGWNKPTHPPDAPKGVRVEHGSPNYYLDFKPPVPWDEIARLAVKTLQVIGVAEPSALEYTAWDDQDRPLSLPALRLNSRTPRPVRHRPKSAPSRPAPKASKLPPAVQEAKAKLLAAVRVFSANNSLKYDDDGEVPLRIGASHGWARFVEQPLVVKLYCVMARDVEKSEALLRRLHEINAEWLIVRLVLAGHTIYAAADFCADPFCVEHFTSCCSALLAMEHEHGEELRSKAAATKKMM